MVPFCLYIFLKRRLNNFLNFFIQDTYKLLEDKFTKMLAHEPDGLIFQPKG